MVGGIMCPDCGGVVGATEPSEDGEPCRCFTASPAESSVDGGSPSPGPPAPKICRICSKDLVGHKRVRDNGSYLCYACHKEEEKRLYQGRVRCRACGHLHKEEKLIKYEGKKICQTCHDERIAVKKARLATLGAKGARTRYEVKQLYMLLAVLAVLLAIIFIGIKLHGRH